MSDRIVWVSRINPDSECRFAPTLLEAISIGTGPYLSQHRIRGEYRIEFYKPFAQCYRFRRVFPTYVQMIVNHDNAESVFMAFVRKCALTNMHLIRWSALVAPKQVVEFLKTGKGDQERVILEIDALDYSPFIPEQLARDIVKLAANKEAPSLLVAEAQWKMRQIYVISALQNRVEENHVILQHQEVINVQERWLQELLRYGIKG